MVTKRRSIRRHRIRTRGIPESSRKQQKLGERDSKEGPKGGVWSNQHRGYKSMQSSLGGKGRRAKEKEERPARKQFFEGGLGFFSTKEWWEQRIRPENVPDRVLALGTPSSTESSKEDTRNRERVEGFARVALRGETFKHEAPYEKEGYPAHQKRESKERTNHKAAGTITNEKTYDHFCLDHPYHKPCIETQQNEGRKF